MYFLHLSSVSRRQNHTYANAKFTFCLNYSPVCHSCCNKSRFQNKYYSRTAVVCIGFEFKI